MFKSIYTKLVATYLSLFLVIILMISVFVLSIFYKEFTRQAEQDLINAGDKTNVLMERYYNNEISKTELTAWINAMSYISNIKIYILNPDTSILHQVETSEEMSFEHYIANDIKQIMQGESVKKLTPVKLETGDDVIYVGMPLIYNEKISGIILLFSPVTELNYILQEVIYTMVAIIVISVLLCTLAILKISIRISEPIVNISEYAKQIGKGEDVEDIEIKSKDEIGKLANSFNEMKKELSVAEQMRREIVANVSHELRTPLTSIIGFIKGILDGVISKEDERKYLLIVYDEANRLKDLTRDIVEVAKLESGNTKLNKEKFYINDLINDVYIEMETLVKEKNLEFIYDEREKNIEIEADKSRIKQVLINVVNNAVKYTNNGHIKMILEKEDEQPKITIEDTGIGIRKDKIAYLFNKFYTANDYGNATSGAGLGLNIVKNIIDIHGGRVKVESEENKGTKVIINI